MESSQKSFEICNSLLQEFVGLCETYGKIEHVEGEEVAKLLENESIPSKKRVAVMLELLRRADAEFDNQLRKYLFTLTPVSEMI